MAKYKNDPANTDYDAGDLFDYSVWKADSEISLCNVPWDATYKDVVHFTSTNSLNAYIDRTADITRLTRLTYARIDEPIQIDMPFSRASEFNYVRVYNTAQPVSGGDIPKYFYYFIRGVRHVNPQCTELLVQLDVWQTYVRQIQFGRAYIESGHIGIANADNFRSFGRDFLTTQEGLNTGADYVSVAQKDVVVMDPFANSGEPTFNVMAICTVDLNGNHGTQNAPLTPSAKPSYIQSGIPSGAGVYVWDTAADFMAFMNDYSTKPWITAGIVSITLLPAQQRWFKFGFGFAGAKDPKTRARRGYITPTIRRNLFSRWRESTDILNYIPARYRHLKKFLTAPYCMLELTFNAGSAIVLRPEAWNSRDATIIEKLAIIPPSQRMAAIPANYNGRNPTPIENDGGIPDGANWYKDGDYLDMAVFLSAFPTIPIVNNGQIMYLAQNARSIASQYSSNEWSQQRALAGNQLGADQAAAGVRAGVDQANNAISSDYAQTAISNQSMANQAMFGLLSGAGQGIGMGAFAGPAGALAGGAGAAVGGYMNKLSTDMQIGTNNEALAARNNSAVNSANISRDLGNYMTDSNKGYADWAAKGDYNNNRQALDAKIQDTNAIQHGMSGQFGGETFNLVNDDANLTLKIKMIDQASMANIGEHWLRFGYQVHRTSLIPNDLRVMTKFSYWKLNELYIRRGRMPEVFKQTIRGILEKGVTVWSNADDIGVIDFADNAPLEGIKLEGYEPPEWQPDPEPEPPTKRKRKKNMIIFGTNDAGMKYALAGTAPGTDANFIITESETEARAWLDFYGAEEAVMLEVTKFYEYQNKYLAPVLTLEQTV